MQASHPGFRGDKPHGFAFYHGPVLLLNRTREPFLRFITGKPVLYDKSVITCSPDTSKHMKDAKKPICFAGFVFGICAALLLSSCSDTPMSARVPPAQNDETVWEGKKLREWRRDLRGFRNVQKCAAASAALTRAGSLAVDGLSKDVNDGSVFFVNVWAAQSLYKIGPDAKEALPALQTAVATAQENGKSHTGWRNFEPWGRAAIVSICGESGDHISKIALFLQDSDGLVKINACRALGQLGPRAQSALPALNRAKQDNDKSVRECASEAISAIESGR